MKIVHVSFFYDNSIATEEGLLEKHYTVTGWAEALQRQGADVIVINRFSKESSLQKNGVHYLFIKDSLPPVLKSRHIPFMFLKKISRLDADIIHLHNLTLSVQTFLLRRMLKRKTVIIIQHHGGVLPRRKKRWLHNLFNSIADGFFFTTIDQGKEWCMNKINPGKILPVMEGATFFNYAGRDTKNILTYNDRSKAREKTGLSGSLVFLWVGRLDDNKDPLTVLDGFEILLGKHPDVNLYMIYNDSRLSNKVKRKINDSVILKNMVHLLGKIEHHETEQYYNSADYFVLGSHSEGSGYALSEALSCGCIPIVTDIPSFRMMTNNGQLGALWEPGNKNSFVEAADIALSKPFEQEAKDCIDFFTKNLSFDAIAETAMGHYQKVIKQRQKS